MGSIERVFGRFRGKSVSTNRKILAASAIIAVIGFGVKLVSLANASFIAKFFGTTYRNDCYLEAFLIPMTLGAVLSGSLNQVLIPTYIEVRDTEGQEAGHRLFTSMLMWNTVALLGLSGILLATTGLWLPLMASKFNPHELQLTTSLLQCLIPIVLIGGFTSMWGAVLNSKERFGVVAIGPIMQPTMAIVFMFAFQKQWGIFALAYGTVFGSLLEAILVGYTVHRTGHPLFPRWFGMTDAVRRVRAQYFACIAGAIVLNGTSLVDMGFAGSLGQGSVATLNYGIRVPGVFIALMLTAVGTAVLPMYSQLVAKRDWAKLRHTIRTCVIYLLIGSVIVTLILIACSPLIIRILFEHGKFTSKDTEIVSHVQRLSLLGAPVAIMLVPVTRTFTALRANNIMSMVSVGSLILNAVADYVLMKRFGLPGIALATSVWMSLVGVTLFSILYFYLLPKAERTSPPYVEAVMEGPPSPSETAMLDPYETVE